jgi:hypothetical protein
LLELFGEELWTTSLEGSANDAIKRSSKDLLKRQHNNKSTAERTAPQTSCFAMVLLQRDLFVCRVSKMLDVLL